MFRKIFEDLRNHLTSEEFDKLNKGLKEESLQNARNRLGLPEDATEEQIRAEKQDRGRKFLAAERGLPEDATMEEIRAVQHEKHRKRSAAKLGLPEDATWDQIHEILKKDKE
ncbi:hypothetical protein KKC32_03020 [Patescibacteria group bacterium]|nr:hypothetical protein [Patescibacteria group bacterium]